MSRLAVARLWFEGNRFSPHPTRLADFARREWRRGSEALEAAADTATELAAVVDAVRADPRLELRVSRCASASPGGPIEEGVFAGWLDEVLADLARWRPDAVYLSLHGAAITTARDAPERDLLAAVRQAVRGVPVAASFDLHANLNPAIAGLIDFGTGYRTYPHVDMRETAARALAALGAMTRGGPRPRGVIVPVRRVLPSFNMRSDTEPMTSLLATARAAETGDVLDVSLFGGFPYADTADTGASVMVWSAASGAPPEAVARPLAQAMASRAGEFRPVLRSADDGLREALSAPDGLVAVTDPADNPLSGGAADTPGLFAALLAQRQDPGSPVHALAAGAVAFAFFADPSVVAHARAAGVGATLATTLGATTGTAFGAPVPVRARVLRFTDGRFVNTGPMERGSVVTLGSTVVLDVAGLQVVVTESVGAANDPAFFALHGIGLGSTRLLCVKAKNHFRAAFQPLCRAIVDVDCPGPAAADLRSLPFRRAPLLEVPDET